MKFTLITLLLVVAFIAAWLATLQASPALGQDLRQPLRWLAFNVPIVAAIYCDGRQRAFFLGSVVIIALTVVLPHGEGPGPGDYRYIVRWLLDSVLGEDAAVGDGIFWGVQATIDLLVTLTSCLIGGVIAMAIYDGSRKREA